MNVETILMPNESLVRKTLSILCKHKKFLTLFMLIYALLNLHGQNNPNTYLIYNLDAYCSIDKMEIEDGSIITSFNGSNLYTQKYSNCHLNIYFTVGYGYQVRTSVYPNRSNYTQSITINGCTKQIYYGCPISLSVQTNNDVANNLSFTYGKFSSEIPTPKLYYKVGSGSSKLWTNSSISYSSSGGTFSLNLKASNDVTVDNLFTTKYEFELTNVLRDGSEVYEAPVYTYFYDRPTILPEASVVCNGGNVHLRAGYMNFNNNSSSSTNPLPTSYTCKLEATLTPSNDASWRTISKELTNVGADLSFNDVAPDNNWLGKQIFIRPYRMCNGEKITGPYAPIVFLPVPNVTITSQAPTCYAGQDASITLTFNDVPTSGCVDPNNASVPIILTVYQYGLDALSKDVTYSVETIGGVNYYYHNGGTMIKNLNLTGTNQKTFNWSDFGNNFKFERGMYKVEAQINSETASCPATSPYKFLDAPTPFIPSAKANTIDGYSTYHVKTGDNHGTIKFKFRGGSAPYEIHKDSKTGELIKSLSVSELTPDSTYSLNIITDQTETTIRTYYIKDNYECSNSGAISVSLNRPPDIRISRSDSTKTTCNTRDTGDHGNGMVSWVITGGYDVLQSSIALYRLPDKTTAIPAVLTRKTGGIVEFSGNVVTKGDYVIKVTDKLNSSYSVWSDPILVDEPAALSISAIPHHPSCDYKNDGSLELSATGGESPYSFTVKKGTAPIADYTQGLSDGIYTIIVQDNKYCTQSASQKLNDPLTLTLDARYLQAASCSTISNAQAKAVVTNFRSSDNYVTFKIGTTSLTKSYDGNNIFSLTNLQNTENALITVTDAYSNCEATDTIRIPLRSPQFSATSATDIFAPCTNKYGTVKLTMQHPEGSNFAYSLDGGSASSFSGYTQTIPLKGKTKHTVIVTDVASGCRGSLTNVIAEVRPDSLKLKRPVDKTSTWCASVNTGQIKVEKQDGWGNINFQISPDSSKQNTTSATFYKLFTGWHTITATDDSLCTDTVKVYMPINPNTLSLSFYNSVKAACKGESYTGEIKVSRYVGGAKKGFGNVTYTLGSLSKPDSTFYNQKFGLYTITSHDDLNCPASITDSVKFDSNPVSITIDSLYHQRCNEVKNARIYLKAHTNRGADQTFRFSLKGDTTTWHAPTIAYNVDTAGRFIFGVIDRNNCGTNLIDTLKNLHYAPKPTLDSSFLVACRNATNGSLSIYNTPNNSVPKYKYQLGARTLFAGAAGDKVIFLGLPRGYHIITATDTLGCSDTARFVVNVRSDSVHIPRIDVTPASCIAARNGKAKMIGSSFNKSEQLKKYKFTFDNKPLYGDSVTFTNIPVKQLGTYLVTVRDTFGCQNTSSFSMGFQNDTLQLNDTIKIINVACPDSSDGIFKVKRMFGDGSFRYQVTSSSSGFSRVFYSSNAMVSVNKLPYGSYKISVRDTNNCVANSGTIVITQPEEIRFEYDSLNYLKRKGDNYGYTKAKVAEGNNKYNYQWINLKDNSMMAQDVATNNTQIKLTGLYAGTYLLRVRDTANCFVGSNGWLEKQFTMLEPEQDLALGIKRLRRVSCFGLSDGEFQLKATGGWGNNYQYGFDALHLYADSIFSNRPIGTVTMFAKDTSGVIVSLPVTITQPALLTASLASKVDANCFGSADGSATIDILEGNKPKYFVAADTAHWISGNVVSGLPLGDYIIHVRDSLYCSTTVPVSIKQPSEIVRTSYRTTETRCGFGNGMITTKINGGIPGYSYQWYKGNTLLPYLTDSAYNLFSGSYRLTVTDAHNCNMSFPFNVSDITDLAIDTITTKPVTCFGYSDGSAAAQLSRGNPPYILTWPDSTHLNFVNGLKSGLYSLWVTDQEKCNVFKDFTIGTPLNIYLNSKIITDPLCEGVNDGALDVTANGSFSGFTYKWSTGSAKNAIKDLRPGNYTLTVTDDHSCTNQFNFSLKYQQYIQPSLGADLTLCKGNTFRLYPGLFNDYKWTSSVGLTSRQPEVFVNKAGSYFVDVTDNYSCIGHDTIKISQSTAELQAKLLLASSVEQNDTVMIFEASWPLPDSVKFQLNGCKILSSGTYYREVIFLDTGIYVIGLTSYINDCLDMVSKEIKVEPKSYGQLKSASAKLIQQFTAAPNPSNGEFTAEITLRESAAIQLHLANVATGVISDFREYKGSDIYTVRYHISNLPSGTYILHLQAGKEAKTKTLIIQK